MGRLALRGEPRDTEVGPGPRLRVVGRGDVPQGLVVGVAVGVEHLSGDVVVDVPVREQVQPRVQGQGPLAGRTVVREGAFDGVEGLGLDHVPAAVLGAVVRVEGLDQLRDAAGDEEVARGEGDHGRVPAAVVHLPGGGPLPGLGVVEAGRPQTLELRHPVGRLGDLGVVVVVGPAHGEELPVGHEDHVRAEEREVVVRVLGVAVQRGREERARVVVPVIDVGAHGVGNVPGRALGVVRVELEVPRLVLHGRPSVLGRDAELDVLGRLHGVEVEDVTTPEDRHRAGRRLALLPAVVVSVGDALLFRRLEGELALPVLVPDAGLDEGIAELADLLGRGGVLGPHGEGRGRESHRGDDDVERERTVAHHRNPPPRPRGGSPTTYQPDYRPRRTTQTNPPASRNIPGTAPAVRNST